MKKALIFLMACVLCVAMASVAFAAEHNTISEAQETQQFQELANGLTKKSWYYAYEDKKESPLVSSITSYFMDEESTYDFVDGDGTKYYVVCKVNTVEVAPSPNCLSEGNARLFCMRTLYPYVKNEAGKMIPDYENGKQDKDYHYHYVTLPKTAHAWSHTTANRDNKQAEVLVEPTCYSEGKVANNYCLVCG